MTTSIFGLMARRPYDAHALRVLGHSDPVGMYSRLARAAETLPAGRPLKSQSVMNLLRKAPEGFAQQEVGLTGLERMLASSPTTTRDDILRHLTRNSIIPGESRIPVVKLGSRTPWGTTYRGVAPLNEIGYGETIVGYKGDDLANRFGNDYVTGDSASGRQLTKEEFDAFPAKITYRHPEFPSLSVQHHWPYSSANPLYHYRTSDGVVGGPATKHLIELQSDLHQYGGKFGYTPEEFYARVGKDVPDDFAAAYKRASDAEKELRKYSDYEYSDNLSHAARYDAAATRARRAQERFDDIADNYGVKESRKWESDLGRREVGPMLDWPNAPFRDDEWRRTALRQLMLDAVNEGAERMTWSGGDEIAGLLGRLETPDTLAGMRTFYNEIIPSEVAAIAKRAGATTRPTRDPETGRGIMDLVELARKIRERGGLPVMGAAGLAAGLGAGMGTGDY